MKPITIGLLGAREDEQVALLTRSLQARGASALTVDLTDIPAYVRFQWRRDELGFGDLDLLSLDAVYARTAWFPQPTTVPGRAPEESLALTSCERETGALLNSIVSELAERLPVINPPSTYHFHRQKPFMYRMLDRARVPVPDFMVGCDLGQAAYFVQAHRELVVAKPLMGGAVEIGDLAFLRDRHGDFDRRPLMLQRRILGRSLRGYVVDGVLVAWAEVVHGDVVDWRTDVRALRATEPTPEVRAVVERAAAALGLTFAAVDVEEESGAGGTPWVLDVNPSPMFAAFEELSGLDVAGPLADCLIRRARADRRSTQGGKDTPA